MLRKIKHLAEAALYRVWRLRATSDQRQHLPKRYGEYVEYRQTYGIAPGDAYQLGRTTAIIVEIEGAPTMDARVTYHEVETGSERTTGLANIHRQI